MPGDTIALIQAWSSLSLDDLKGRLERNDEEFVRFFGLEQVQEMRMLAQAPRRASTGVPPAVVVLPGIMGSLLQSTQGLIDLLWVNPLTFARGRVNLLEMDETGEQDGDPRVHIAATSLELLYYTKFIMALSQQVDLFQFPYDWRRDIRALAGQLHAALERWAAGTTRRFILVGHSMGGLISRAYLALYPEAAERRVERVILLGTPNHGAPEAIRNLIQGNDLMNLAKRLHENNDGQRLVRRIPAIYQLLPAPQGLWPTSVPYPTNFDLYNAQAWPIPMLNQRFLDAGRAFWELLAEARPRVPHVLIAGCNLETTTGVRVGSDTGGQVTLQIERGSIGMAGGDGTVPLVSALLPGAETYYVQCEHAKMPGHSQVIEGVIHLAFGRRPALSTEIVQPTRVFIPPRHTVVLDQDAEALRARIATGSVSAQDIEKLYFLL
jgi:pimeloyl-ACP methyl ester carboxylesterase